jgi:hypothetical protein
MTSVHGIALWDQNYSQSITTALVLKHWSVKWLWFMGSLYCLPGMTPKLHGWVAATAAITKCYLQKEQSYKFVLQWSTLQTPSFHISCILKRV